VKMPPNMTIEQLETREIQGIPANGVKTTTLGYVTSSGTAGGMLT